MVVSKQTKTTSEILNNTAKQAGYLLLATAATLGMLDTPSHDRVRAVLPNQPVFAFEENDINVENLQGTNSIRREREEVAPHYISYSEVQRTASRAGKI